MPRIFYWTLLVGVTLVALGLRVHDLARRPMHADEANQAVKAGELLEGGRYAFDPRDHHGPTLYYAVLPIAWMRGQHTLRALDETTVRLVPAIAGTLGVLLLAALAAPLGRGPSLVAAAFMALSPPAVYYSRYFVQETLLVTFTLGALVCAQQFGRTRRVAWAIGAGGCGGLMLATKESAPLFLFAAAVAAVVGVGRGSPQPRAGDGAEGGSKPGWLPIAVAGGAAFVVALIFYSSCGTHLAGVRDALAAFGNGVNRAAGASGHEKPWWYYAQLFAWQRRGGVAFEQIALSVLALAGVGIAWRTGRRLLRGAAVYLAVIALALSLVPYKTPWHAIQFVPPLALLAAGALAAVPVTWVAGALGVIALASQCYQTNRVAFVYPADARNPYAYVHSAPDVLKYRPVVEAALARSPGLPVRIISEEYWPLPWYLRGLPRLGYWSAPPDACDGALVIASASQAGAVRTRLHGTYRESFLGLRPGFVCVVFTPAP